MANPHRSILSRLSAPGPDGLSFRPGRRFAWAGALVFLGLMGDLVWIHQRFPVPARSQILRQEDATRSGLQAPVLVLGAGVFSDGEPTAVLEARLEAALVLHRAGRAPWFIVSGDNRALNYNEPMAMRRWLLKRGVPEASIVNDFAGRRTYDSLRRARDVFGVRRLYVVTSDFHLPRALYIARKLGLEAWGLAASTGEVHAGARLVFHVREWMARHKAILDGWFPPDVLLGPHEPTPDNPMPDAR